MPQSQTDRQTDRQQPMQLTHTHNHV